MAFRRTIRGKLSRYYYVDFWVPDKGAPDAIHINKSTRMANLDEAQDVEDQWRAEAEEAYFSKRGHLDSLNTMTLSQAADAVFQDIWQFNATGQKSRRQVDIIIEVIGYDPSLIELSGSPGAVFVSDIKKGLLGHGVHETGGRRIGPETVDRYMAAMKTVLNFVRKKRMMADMIVPPIDAIGTKRQRERELYLDEEKELFKLARIGDPDYCDLWEFLLDTGARVSEALNLSWRDSSIQLKSGYVRFETLKNKNHPPRRVYLTRRAKRILLSRKDLGDSRPFMMSATQSSHKFKKYRKALGIDDPDFVPHMLRHTCTTRLLHAGHQLPDVQSMLGHSDERMTLYYNKGKRGGSPEAAEILDRINGAGDEPAIDARDLEIQRLRAELEALKGPTDTETKSHNVAQNQCNTVRSSDKTPPRNTSLLGKALTLLNF